jgi:hypothetical protein
MTAEIILFPRRWMSRSSQLPHAIDVATEHIWWLRRTHPEVTPQTAAAMIGRLADTWDEAISAYADLWDNLPKSIRLR